MCCTYISKNEATTTNLQRSAHSLPATLWELLVPPSHVSRLHRSPARAERAGFPRSASSLLHPLLRPLLWRDLVEAAVRYHLHPQQPPIPEFRILPQVCQARAHTPL